MKITRIETIRWAAQANVLWLRLHTDKGPVGLGESFRACAATEAFIHESCAPHLLGRDPRRIGAINLELHERMGDRFFGVPTRSVEWRALSAIDIALWDILGQSLGCPVTDLLGGACRERIRTYNTCANASYNASPALYGGVLPRHGEGGDVPAARFEDHDAAIHRPAGLARELLAEGITGMKIWPFDGFALESNGTDISLAQIAIGLDPVRRIREAVGDSMEIMLEFHGRWQLPAAIRIAKAARDFGIRWFEDPIRMANIDDLAAYRRETGVAVAACESHATAAWLRDALARRAVDYVLFDVGWVGGISAGLQICKMAEAFDRPVAPHDCVGPVVLCASMALVMSAPNGLTQESVRAYMNGYYKDVVTDLPRLEDGHLLPLDGPGIGTRLREDFLAREDITHRYSEA